MRNLRSWFKDASSADIQDVIGQLEKLKLEKMREEDELYGRPVHIATSVNSSNVDHGMRLESRVSPQMILDGLLDRLSCRSRRYRSLKIKYRYYDLDGHLCEWSGQGRLPVKLRELLDKTGKSKEDFLVKDEEPLPNLEQSPSQMRIAMGIDNAHKIAQTRLVQDAIATLYPSDDIDIDDLPPGSNLDDDESISEQSLPFTPKLMHENMLNADEIDPDADFSPEDLITGERHIAGSSSESDIDDSADSANNLTPQEQALQESFVNKLRTGHKVDRK